MRASRIQMAWIGGLIAMAIGASACKKEQTATSSAAEPGAAAPAAAKAAADPAASGPFAAFDMAGITKRWQGDWVVKAGFGKTQAWHVAGDKVTVFDGQKEETLEFSVVAPCQVKLTKKSGSGSSSTYTKFTFDGDTLYAGLGNAGLRKGKAVVACVSADIFTHTDGKCLRWRKSMFGDKMQSKPGECGIKAEGGKETFEAKGMGSYVNKLDVAGEVLHNMQMKGNLAKRAEDFAAAKAAIKG